MDALFCCMYYKEHFGSSLRNKLEKGKIKNGLHLNAYHTVETLLSF